jgi:hypothetical protein
MVVAVNVNQMNNGKKKYKGKKTEGKTMIDWPSWIGANPNMNPHCNKMVKIVGTTGNEIIARIVDTCPTCQVDSLDLSPTGK